MKRILKYLFRIIGGVLIVVLLIPVLLYIPAVQRFVKNKAVEYVAENYHMVAGIEHFSLKFPLELTLEKVFAGKSDTDTLAYVEHLRLDVGIWKLLKKEVSVNDLQLSGVKFNLKNDTSGLNLTANVAELSLRADRIDLADKSIDIDELKLRGGDVVLIQTGGTAEQDTVPGKLFDWLIRAKLLEFTDVNYRMESPSLPSLIAGAGQGKIVNGTVSVAGQLVTVDSVNVVGGFCRMVTAVSVATPPEAKKAGTDSLWTVKAANVAMQNSFFSMNGSDGKGFDIRLEGIGVEIDSVYNRGTDIRAALRQLQVVRPEGGQIDAMRADIDLSKDRTEAGNVYIQTPNSLIRLDAYSDGSLDEVVRRNFLKVKLDASVGGEDIRLFYAALPKEIRRQKVRITAEAAYRADEVDLKNLTVVMPGHFNVRGKGKFTSLRKLSSLSGSLDLSGNFPDMTFLNGMLKGGGVTIPADLKLDLKVRANKGTIVPDLKLFHDGGKLTMAGTYRVPSVAYDVQVNADSLNVGHFLSNDSLGRLTAGVQLTGRGVQFGKAEARLLAEINSLRFNGYPYRDIRLAADIKRVRIDGNLKSDDPALLADLTFTADSAGKEYMLDLKGNIAKADLMGLNLVSTPFTASMECDLDATLGEKNSLIFNAVLNQIFVDNGAGPKNLGGLLARMESDRKRTLLDVVSGDFRLSFASDTVVSVLSSMFAAAGKEIGRQIEKRRIDMDKIHEVMPDFTLGIYGNNNNVISKYLKTQGIGFKHVALEASESDDGGLKLAAKITYPNFKKTRLDSLDVLISQQQQGLDYTIDIMNESGGLENLAKVRMSGFIRQNQARFAMKQQDIKGDIGVDAGINVELRDSSILLSLFPLTPILGYSRWVLNAGNNITVNPDWKITADLNLSYQDKLVSVQTLNKGEKGKEQLQVKVNGIDLASVSGVLPFVPELAGSLNTDLLFYSRDSQTVADGRLLIKDFYYQEQKIGTVDLDINYNVANRFTHHVIDFTLHLDDLKRLVAKGSFSTSEQDKGIKVDVDIPSLPLYVINAFIPSGLLKLDGDLHGKMAFRGTFARPDINGGIAFRQGKAEMVMLGTSFDMDTVYIPVKQGRIHFNKYRFIAPNKESLWINGDIVLVPFSDMRADLKLTANRFQAVNVKDNPHSLVFGKAYVDVNVGIKGPFSGLNLTGNVNLLNNTNLNYVLRNSAPELKDKSIDLVRFVSFGDTTLNEEDQMTNRVSSAGFTMKLLVEVGNDVNVNINLSEDGENRVVIKGGGNLIYSMNPEIGNSLVGKYTLTGGMVRYGIPVVGEKNFTIQSGSYVEWTGNMLNPTLNITASESIKVSVTEDNQSSRLVVFDAMIRIQNNLQQPEITFDLSAPNDQAIQGQLTSFSAEERTKQAMNLLIYGTYSGPGTINTGTNANNTLNNFVEKELNQWSRKYLKNAGLTFGIDSYNQIGAGGQEVKRTDYSYQFSKQLFNDKVNVKVGGRISSDSEPGSSMEENLVDDIAIEYTIGKKRELFLKVFRHTNYESVLEGEVTQTGVGVVWRRSFQKVKDLFIRKKKKEAEMLKRQDMQREPETVSEQNKIDTIPSK